MNIEPGHVNRCHLGKSVIYDTISNLSWSSDIRTHTIQTVIQKLLSDPWPPSLEVGREVPEAMAEEDCVVSFTAHIVLKPLLVSVINRICIGVL